jgi:glycosyltransferase involved in cell wall biosynthesis
VTEQLTTQPSSDRPATEPSGVLPEVTVVVPTRGRRELVRRTVESIVGQRYDGPIRVVVVHDQEDPDPTLEELALPHRRVDVVVNTGHPGLAGSRNFGLTLCDTEIVASCDDDDTWLPDKVRLQVERLQSDPRMLVVGGGIRLLMPRGRVVEWLGPADEVGQADLFRSRRKELHSSTLLMRRAAFELAGDYDTELPQSYAEDYEWLLRAVRHGRIGVVREPLANIKKDGESWFRERAEVIAEALEYVLRVHPEIARSRRGYARVAGQIAFARANLGQRRDATRWLLRSMGRWPLSPQAGLALFQLVFRVDPRLLLRSARVMGRGLT